MVNVKNIKLNKRLFSIILAFSIIFSNLLLLPKESTAETMDISSSTVDKYPVVYNSTTGTSIYNDIGRYKLSLIGNSNTLGYDRGRALSRPYYEHIDVDDDELIIVLPWTIIVKEV